MRKWQTYQNKQAIITNNNRQKLITYNIKFLLINKI